MASLKDKVVIITGSSAGIGQGVAVHFAKLGCKLSLTGRDATNLAKVVQQCMDEGLPKEKITSITGELTNEEDRKKLVDNTISAFGRIDVLVNNAGIFLSSAVEETTADMYDSLIDVNQRCPFFLSQLVIPYLKQSKGNIVNVSSMFGVRPIPDAAAYCMTKAALDMFTQCLALELAPYGIRVNSVNPGSVVSMVLRRSEQYKSDEDYQKLLDLHATLHPLGRVGVPEDVAKAVAFLASDEASFISGHLMLVDGARHCGSDKVSTK